VRGSIRGLAVLAAAGLLGAGLWGIPSAVAVTSQSVPTLLSQTPAGDRLLGHPGTPGAERRDGRSGTRWVTLSGDGPQWIVVGLGGTASLTRIRLEWDASYATAYTLQTSPDRKSFTDISAAPAERAGWRI